MTMAQLKPRSRGPEVLAKLDSPCKGCDRPIVGGEDYICIVEGLGTMHALCAANYCQILEEHVEEETGSSADGEDL